MYTIDNKFELGEKCWSVYREKIKYECPICEMKKKNCLQGLLNFMSCL